MYNKVYYLKNSKYGSPTKVAALRKRYKTVVGDAYVVNPRASARPDKEPVEMTPATAEEINDEYVVVEDDCGIMGPPMGV